MRSLKADKLLVENIRTLLYRRGIDAKALARWCGHEPAWLSKILKGERGMQVADVGRVAEFFGLTVSELFSPGISPLTERRQHTRRTLADRRQVPDRRSGHREGALHPDVQPKFPDQANPRHSSPRSKRAG